MFGHHHHHHHHHGHDRHQRCHRRGRRHGGPPPWVHHFMGGTQRPERGEVRYLILAVLEKGPAHGYELIQRIEERTQGAYRPSPGTIYPTLQLLEEMDLVTAEARGSRKVYTLTEAGTAELDKRREEIEEAWDRLGTDIPFEDFVDFGRLGRRVRRVMHGARREVRRGKLSPEELKEVGEVIEEAFDRIEAIIFGEPPKDEG